MVIYCLQPINIYHSSLIKVEESSRHALVNDQFITINHLQTADRHELLSAKSSICREHQESNP